MIIGIDIDDTLTDTFDFFQPCVAEFFGLDIEFLKAHNISCNNIPAPWNENELEFCRAYYDDLAPETPFKPDAAWGMARLHEMGHRTVVITARTPDFYTDPYATTRLELENGHIEYDKLVCTLDKKSACLAEGVELFIDDSVKNCTAVNSEGIPVLLFECKANADTKTDFTRVSSWAEIIELVKEMQKQH